MADGVGIRRGSLVLCVAWLVVAPLGAEEPHWAYQPVRVTPVGPLRLGGWSRGAIDHYVLDRLEAVRRRPAVEARPEVLLRRVTLDLTGLPPTPLEVEAFVNDTSPDAYERVLDRLFRSPGYAERMATWWLDMARYADTHGYEGDGARQIWLYRDWVIDAFLQGMPFDRFSIDQLAGDLLPHGTESQRVATGFHRNSPFCYEGGTDLEQFRVEAVVDRVNTTMTVWMGTTFGCAQCHDHKYDPVSQLDYFQLYAFFNNSTEATGASFSAVSPLKQTGATTLRSRIAALQEQVRRRDVADFRRNWLADQQEREWRVWDVRNAKSSGGASIARLADHSLLVSGENPQQDDYEIEYQWPGGRFAALGLEVLHHPSLPKGGPGRYPQNGNFGLSTLEIDVAGPQAGAPWRNQALAAAWASYAEPQDQIRNALNGQRACWCTNQREAQGWFVLANPRELSAGHRIRVRLRHASKWERHGIGRFRLWSAGSLPANVFKEGFPALDVLAILSRAEQSRTPAETQKVDAYLRAHDPSSARLRKEIDRSKQELEPTKTLVMQEREEPRTTHLLVAGSHLNPGVAVSAGVPDVWHAWDAAWPRNRLGLAQWLMSDRNPLVGRVTSNRVWSMFFGEGIVRTSEDFGVQGAAPTHPRLLDYLAAYFVGAKWNLQALQRQIVMSATYRQSSDVPVAMRGADTSDRWYGRGPAFRLPAESIRDVALAVSGLLDRRVGGPGVFPYQPQGVYEQIHSYTTAWKTSERGQQFRRGVYTWWKRTAPYPSMIAFDAPRRSVCVERRPRTNTPLQALVTLNDPVFVQSARALARRMQLRDDGSCTAGLHFGFRLCVARPPTEQERGELRRLYQRAAKAYRTQPAAAESLSGGAVVTGQQTDSEAAVEFAAWVTVANVLLNLDETLMKY
ncbi:MAG: DUF1549 and DUF1553 domain-containing protein [Planctomycetota bacterium]|nr:DUF1549 and DUF1553 domain-containing protein [Planctomycetota bacterium]